MELVLPMYNVHPYFSLKTLGKRVSIIHSKIWYIKRYNANKDSAYITQYIIRDYGEM